MVWLVLFLPSATDTPRDLTARSAAWTGLRIGALPAAKRSASGDRTSWTRTDLCDRAAAKSSRDRRKPSRRARAVRLKTRTVSLPTCRQ